MKNINPLATILIIFALVITTLSFQTKKPESIIVSGNDVLKLRQTIETFMRAGYKVDHIVAQPVSVTWGGYLMHETVKGDILVILMK